MELSELIVKLVAVTVPNVTAVAPVKLLPVSVTIVPPPVLPEDVEMPLTAGSGARVYVN
jgi:hypothetical protein